MIFKLVAFLVLMATSMNSPTIISGFVQHSTTIRQSQGRQALLALSVIWDPKNNEDQINSELVEFPTPAQKIELKKEANKRLARKKLPFFKMPEDESFGSFSDETLTEIWGMLQEHELILIRGIAIPEKKIVFQLATRLCLELEWEQERKINDLAVLPVALLSTKGHSAIVYSPTLDLAHPNKFPLRTSVGQKNTWTERIKAPRDHRGQIVEE